jgi:hypothetical protein
MRTEDASRRVFRFAVDRKNITPFVLNGTAVRILDIASNAQDAHGDADVKG